MDGLDSLDWRHEQDTRHRGRATRNGRDPQNHAKMDETLAKMETLRAKMDTLIVPMETLIVLLYAPKRSYCMHRNIKRTGFPLRTRLRIALVWSSLVCMHISWGGICTSLLWQSAVDVRCRPVLGASGHPVPLITVTITVA